MSGYSKIYFICERAAYIGSDGMPEFNLQIWQGEGHIQWLEPKYFDSRLSPIGKINQENGNIDCSKINFNDININGSYIFRKSWYGKIVNLGIVDGYPVYTFTSYTDFSNEISKPSEEYLKCIADGLREAYELNAEEIAEYLVTKSGIKENYSTNKILKIINQTQGEF